jgi:ABC-2 type transport system permease protein
VNAATYTRYELVRTYRNWRFMLFSLAFPVVLFLLVAGPNRHQRLGGISFPVYYMAGMVAWGTMAAMIASGARIATERAVGWNRQLRITPLTTRAYFRTKVLAAYALAGLSIVVLYTAGVSLGVRLSAGEWLTMTGLILVGLIPFAVLGILLGHLLTVDSIGPAVGGLTSLLALLGGAWGPIGQTGLLHQLVTLLPSYWLVHAGDVVLRGSPWGAKGWLVVTVWTLGLLRFTARVYRRDTKRA